MNVQFRRAGPGDVEEAIPLIYSSGPHEYDYTFAVGRHKVLDFLRTAFVDGSSTVGYGSYVVAVADGHVVGIGAFHDGAKYERANRKVMYPVVRFYGPLTGWGVLRRGMDLQQELMPSPKRGDLFIQNVGVSVDMRGRGIGTALLRNQIDPARSKGFRRCILDVAVTNPRAQALYERLGFRVVEERKSRFTNSTVHVPDMRRMEMLL